MKKLKTAVLFVFFILLILSTKVEAYSGELDPKGYITMPSSISGMRCWHILD